METNRKLLTRRLASFLAFLLLIFAGSIAEACNIPVFRFALERWKPDATEVIVFADGRLNKSDLQKVERLRELGSVGKAEAATNLQVILIDVSESAKLSSEYTMYRNLWDSIRAEQSKETGKQSTNAITNNAYTVIRTRIGKDKIVVSWKGPLRDLDPEKVANSPARRELSRRLIAGDSVVWLVLRSSNKQRSDELVKQLRGQFQRLSAELQLPDGVGLPGSELYSEVPLFLQFSVLEIDPADSGEWYLVESLSRLEPRFREDDQPLVIPVFGKGRALEVMAASDVTPELTEDLTRFLCSACSCQVKELNPGFDLVMSVPWNQELFGEELAPEMAAPAGTGSAGSSEPVLVPIPSGKAGRK